MADIRIEYFLDAEENTALLWRTQRISAMLVLDLFTFMWFLFMVFTSKD